MSNKLTELLAFQSTDHWGCHYDFQPYLLDRIWGDGKQLMQLFPLMERPRYWIVRVGSGTCDCRDEDEFFDMLDEIYDEIDEQFGMPPESDLGVGRERPYFPMFDRQGTSWHFVR